MNMGKFVLNVVAVFILYGLLYGAVGEMVFGGAFDAMMAMDFFMPEEETSVSMLSYHLVQTVIFVWLFNKAVGSGDLKAGAMFGLMMGFYIMASDSVWMAGIKDFPSEARIALNILNIVIGVIVGSFLAFMQGKGWGSAAATEDGGAN